MIFIKKFELFLFVLSLMAYTQARSISISQIGDVRIQMTEDKWICDQIECPLDADRCYVSKSNLKNPSELVRSNICYSRDNKVLKEKTITTPTDPNYNINVQIVSHANGGITSYTGGSSADFDEEKFQQELQHNLGEMQTNLHNQMSGFHENLDHQMNNLHSNLQAMNENINRNLQNQMHNLHQNLRFGNDYEDDDEEDDEDDNDDDY